MYKLTNQRYRPSAVDPMLPPQCCRPSATDLLPKVFLQERSFSQYVQANFLIIAKLPPHIVSVLNLGRSADLNYLLHHLVAEHL